MIGHDVVVGVASLVISGSGVSAILLTSTVLDGLLARRRINYEPKCVSLVSSEKGEVVECSPRIPGLLYILWRVMKLERPGDVYKGLMPMTLSLAVYLVVNNGMKCFLSSMLSPAGLWSTLVMKLTSSIIGLPTMVINDRSATLFACLPLHRYRLLIRKFQSYALQRSIVTPYRLPYFSPARSIRVLLTPAEHSAPWLLFFKPGLLAAQALHDLCTIGFLLPLRFVLVPAMSLPMREVRWGTISPVGVCLLAGVVLLSSLVLCPLEVIVLRLSVQRNSAASTAPPKPEKGGLDLYTPEQEVIRVRGSYSMDPAPYLGLVDCARRIVAEEGWRTLYRGWSATLAACITRMILT